jgi:hypothetical protein
MKIPQDGHLSQVLNPFLIFQVNDTKGWIRKGIDLFGNGAVKMFASVLEKNFLKEVGSMPEITLDG